MLHFNNVPVGNDVRLYRLPCNTYFIGFSYPILAYPDGRIVNLVEPPQIDLNDNYDIEEIQSGLGIKVPHHKDENPFYHLKITSDITVHAESMCGIDMVPDLFNQNINVLDIHWPGRERYGFYYLEDGAWDDYWLSRYHYGKHGHSAFTKVDGRPDLSLTQNWEITGETISDLRLTLYSTYGDGRKYTDVYRPTLADPYYGDITSPGSSSWQYALKQAMSKIYSFAKGMELDDKRQWRASQEATEGVQVYDINMVEGLLNLGIDDLIPLKAASTSLKYFEQLMKGSLATKLLRGVQIAATMYLHNKYVLSNDWRDICTLLGCSEDVGVTISNIINGLRNEDVTADEYNHQLGMIAKKIVYKEDFTSSTYGGYTSDVHTPFGKTVKCITNAKLVANPGPLADLSAMSIITDDLGLKFSATRAIEAVPFEFIVNWFLPVEQLVQDIEWNNAHLESIFHVLCLTLSDKVEFSITGDDLGYYLGLHRCTGGIKFEYYNRTVQDHFPKTVFSFSPEHGGLSGNRILQGGALLITK